ncbi:hypothetical protein BCR34DRAFT_599454 [Clohesyomyces aquaticus]|uniref:F-box domain-containing protein n=1 Tax=Clohesyomyces aquaticus TaxID=1231657 RepID=A0A1Y1ZUZ0_9PLEO|nr:hypothetical protein BCR34DRAFT_599454 [Clohesyomyces aquaticus]
MHTFKALFALLTAAAATSAMALEGRSDPGGPCTNAMGCYGGANCCNNICVLGDCGPTFPPNRKTHSQPKKILSLPAELWQHIASYLPQSSQACLSLSCRYLQQKIGTASQPKGTPQFIQTALQKAQTTQFLLLLSRDMPGYYGACSACQTLRSQHSEFAWPLLKCRRGERGILPPLYDLSEFLTQMTLLYYRHGRRDIGTCLSMLTCFGTYQRPRTAAEKERILKEDPGLSEKDIAVLLSTSYQVTASQSRIRTPAPEPAPDHIISHITYTTHLPHPWTSLSSKSQSCVLGSQYLCPHKAASHLRFEDPTYENSNAGVTVPARDVIGQVWTQKCDNCTAESRTRIVPEGEGKYKMTIEVWRYSVGRCNDGVKDGVYSRCDPVERRVGSEESARDMYEEGLPLELEV